jgi:hypothetical protein
MLNRLLIIVMHGFLLILHEGMDFAAVKPDLIFPEHFIVTPYKIISSYHSDIISGESITCSHIDDH